MSGRGSLQHAWRESLQRHGYRATYLPEGVRDFAAEGVALDTA